MLISNTLKYLPSQVLAPLSQFLSIILWTYFADEKLIGYITLITAFQELAMAARTDAALAEILLPLQTEFTQRFQALAGQLYPDWVQEPERLGLAMALYYLGVPVGAGLSLPFGGSLMIVAVRDD